MSGELARQPIYSDADEQAAEVPHTELSLVPPPEEDPEVELRTSFSIPKKIPKGYAKTRHEQVNPDKEILLGDGKVNGLQVVLDESKNYPLLDASEELELARLIEQGDLEAKEKMFNSNLRLVVANARRYQGQGLAFGDLIQEGMLGLMRAVEKFDYRKGFRFSTYATLWIRQAIQRGLENTSRTIRLPVHVAQRSRKVGRVERELTTKLGHEPSDEEIAAEADMDIADVIEIRKADRAIVSLDKPVGEEGDADFGDLLASDQEDPFNEAADNLENRTLLDAIFELPENERRVIEMRFGIGEEEPLTLSQTGKKIGVSTERARQIEERALKRLGTKEDVIAIKQAEKWESPQEW